MLHINIPRYGSVSVAVQRPCRRTPFGFYGTIMRSFGTYASIRTWGVRG